MTATESATALDELCVDTIRTLSMDAVQKANSGHPGTPMALAPLAYVLYTRVMRHSPRDPHWPDRDRFVLSCRPRVDAAVLDAVPGRLRRQPRDDIEQFRQFGSRAAGHPEYGHLPGIEVTTGPLGQGISNAVGMALAERMLAARFNRPDHEIVDHRTFVIASDGDIEEGISGEASSLAGHLGLGRLICVLRPQPHLDRGRHRARVHRGRRRSATRLRLARPGPRGGHRARRARAGVADGDGGEGPALADHRPYPHRLGQPAQAGHRRRPRLAARRGGGAADQAGDTAGIPTSRSTSPTRRSPTSAAASSAARSCEPNGRRRFDAYRRTRSRSSATSFSGWSGASCPPAGTRTCPRFHASGTMTATRKSSHEVLQWAAAQRPRARRRLGRPRALDAHADRRRRRRRGGLATTGATSTSGSASTRWARS